MSVRKAQPLTKDEVMVLVDLVQSNPILFSRATNASNNRLKEATWSKITKNFNAMIASNPRKPEQLRLKWENLKKAARKRSSKIKMNNLKTRGGKPDFIPPDEALEKVALILGPTDDGYNVPFGRDAVMEVHDDVAKAEESVEDPLYPAPVQPTVSPLRTSPPPKIIFLSSASSKGKLKHEAPANGVKASVIARNWAIAEYYEEKKKIATLTQRKLELEILELEKKLCPDPWHKNIDR